ncbi:S-methyl-5-thioribose kinase, partial [Salmonella enterica subsp. enterica serovar Istanbul]|nr:S-methyl-5-thioribose kinase [Salmonella enterica subsp. enterica serovar Istanbul]
YGPIAFDVGMLLANFWMNYLAQRGHEQDDNRRDMRRYLLEAIETIWETFRSEFSHLWRTERNGILYQRALFEDQDDSLGAE